MSVLFEIRDGRASFHNKANLVTFAFEPVCASLAVKKVSPVLDEVFRAAQIYQEMALRFLGKREA